MNYRECAQLLKGRDRYLLVTHKNPDGDTIASAAALCSALRRAGKTAWLYPNPQITARIRPYVEQFLAPDSYRGENNITVDVAAERLFPHGFSSPVFLCVDHHPNEDHFGENQLIRPEKSSCGEIVLELIKSLCGDVTPEEATLLYIAVTTDTGCFQYANTNFHTLSAAAELLRLEADIYGVTQHFFRKTSLARLRLEGMIYSGLRFFRDGELVIALVTREMMDKAGTREDDLDDLAGLSGRAEGCKVNITIRELPSGESRVSVRSVPGVSSSRICQVFGGGGHDMAAGCTIQSPPELAMQMLLDVMDEVWP